LLEREIYEEGMLIHTSKEDKVNIGIQTEYVDNSTAIKEVKVRLINCDNSPIRERKSTVDG
jgi:hypothetical protein